MFSTCKRQRQCIIRHFKYVWFAYSFGTNNFPKQFDGKITLRRIHIFKNKIFFTLYFCILLSSSCISSCSLLTSECKSSVSIPPSWYYTQYRLFWFLWTSIHTISKIRSPDLNFIYVFNSNGSGNNMCLGLQMNFTAIQYLYLFGNFFYSFRVSHFSVRNYSHQVEMNLICTVSTNHQELLLQP